MNIQYKKGVLELLVLNSLNQIDYYGYDISEYLSQKMSISPGTVYPILRKLKDEGYLTTYLSEASSGPVRKYYQISKLGIKHLQQLKSEWKSFVNITLELLEENHE